MAAFPVKTRELFGTAPMAAHPLLINFSDARLAYAPDFLSMHEISALLDSARTRNDSELSAAYSRHLERTRCSEQSADRCRPRFPVKRGFTCWRSPFGFVVTPGVGVRHLCTRAGSAWTTMSRIAAGENAAASVRAHVARGTLTQNTSPEPLVRTGLTSSSAHNGMRTRTCADLPLCSMLTRAGGFP